MNHSASAQFRRLPLNLALAAGIALLGANKYRSSREKTMQKLIKKPLKAAALLGALSVVGTAHAVAVHDQGIWTRSLQARDLDGNLANGPEAFYDTTLNITWLANVNQNVFMDWNAAKTWAANLNVNGVTGWRLPTIIDTGAPGCQYSEAGGTDCGHNVQTKSGLPTKYQAGQTVYSEMAHLFFVTLGNNAFYAPGTGGAFQSDWGLTNTGDFKNLEVNYYWSGTEYAPDSSLAWYFSTFWGNQNYDHKFLKVNALAVHPGDVTAVPEPQTWALTLLGLTGVLLARRRRAV